MEKTRSNLKKKKSEKKLLGWEFDKLLINPLIYSEYEKYVRPTVTKIGVCNICPTEEYLPMDLNKIFLLFEAPTLGK